MFACVQDGAEFATSMELGRHHRDVHGLPHSEDVGPPRIVAAVASMSGVNTFGSETTRAEDVEEAMAAAVMQAMLEGISLDNTEEILKRKMAARAAVLNL